MTEYRRVWLPGATWFFTVNRASDVGIAYWSSGLMCCELRFVALWRDTPSTWKRFVILPDHLHCVWTLAPSDADFSTGWSLIKGHFLVPSRKASAFRKAPPSGVNEVYGSAVSGNIRDQADFNRHVDYVH